MGSKSAISFAITKIQSLLNWAKPIAGFFSNLFGDGKAPSHPKIPAPANQNKMQSLSQKAGDSFANTTKNSSYTDNSRQEIKIQVNAAAGQSEQAIARQVADRFRQEKTQSANLFDDMD